MWMNEAYSPLVIFLLSRHAGWAAPRESPTHLTWIFTSLSKLSALYRRQLNYLKERYFFRIILFVSCYHVHSWQILRKAVSFVVDFWTGREASSNHDGPGSSICYREVTFKHEISGKDKRTVSEEQRVMKLGGREVLSRNGGRENLQGFLYVFVPCSCE